MFKTNNTLTSFLCFYYFLTYSTPFSSVSFVHFEQVNITCRKVTLGSLHCFLKKEECSIVIADQIKYRNSESRLMQHNT